jgi:chemotaxis protein CheD
MADTQIIHVQTADMQVGEQDQLLQSTGIGSCIVITLYDTQKKIGALAHAMVERPKNITPSPTPSLRYIEDAIDAMLVALKALGVQKQNLVAKLFGGAHMFKVFDSKTKGVGAQNIAAAHTKLQQEGITIVSNDTGGNVGRTVLFDLSTGTVKITTLV